MCRGGREKQAIQSADETTPLAILDLGSASCRDWKCKAARGASVHAGSPGDNSTSLSLHTAFTPPFHPLFHSFVIEKEREQDAGLRFAPISSAGIRPQRTVLRVGTGAHCCEEMWRCVRRALVSGVPVGGAEHMDSKQPDRGRERYGMP